MTCETPAAPPRPSAPGEQPVTVHTLRLAISNAFLVTAPGGALLVDAGLPYEGRRILRSLHRIGCTDLSLIYITHAHIDHFGAAAFLQRATGAPVAVHEADAADLAGGRTRLGRIRNWTTFSAWTLPWVERVLARAVPVRPGLAVGEGDRLDAYGIPAAVLHTPGHTPGSTSLLVDGGAAIVGDLVSGTGRPHAQRSYAQDWRQLAQSLARVQRLTPALVFAGHGPAPISGAAFQALQVTIHESMVKN
jgi:glyoxylase-like metal-dependent hydrolase (beta-lactamase superfamily II)